MIIFDKSKAIIFKIRNIYSETFPVPPIFKMSQPIKQSNRFSLQASEKHFRAFFVGRRSVDAVPEL